MDASIHAKVSIGGLRPVCVMHMFIRARAVDSRSLVMVAANYLLSHLCWQRKSRHMKIRGDGSLIDSYVLLSEPDNE